MGHDFDSNFWEAHYASRDATTRIEPNPQLVREVAALNPGKALDAGCGEGTDALWLAKNGWLVTAMDISHTAIERARKRSQKILQDNAKRITWKQQGLVDWQPTETYDLVLSQYVHLPMNFQDFCRKLGAAVRPGGTLVIIAHQPPKAPGDDPHDHGSHVSIEDIAEVFQGKDWNIATAENRTRTVSAQGGKTITLHDAVFRAEKL